MLTIRQEQINALEGDARRRFHEKLRAILRNDLPRQTAKYDDQDMLRKIAIADKKAQAYGIVSERGIGQFVALEFYAGPDFDRRPKTNRYLMYPNIEPHHKIETLFDYLVERDRMTRGA